MLASFSGYRGWDEGTASAVSCTHFCTVTGFTEEAGHSESLTSAGGRTGQEGGPSRKEDRAGGRTERVLDHPSFDGHSAGVPPRLRTSLLFLGLAAFLNPG